MRAVRPASLEVAVRDYPKLVLLLAQNKLRITPDSPNTDHSTVFLECASAYISMRISSVDLDIIRIISSQFVPVLSIFPSEPASSIEDRARALVRVQFGNRKAY